MEHMKFNICNQSVDKAQYFLDFKVISSTGNRKTWARISAQSKASFFPQKDFQFEVH